MFRAPGAEFWCAEAIPDRSGHRFLARGRATPSDGRFVVVSQSCDIAASIEKEPVVEAFPCAPEPDPTVRASYNRSFRWFEVDRTEGLVAHAMYRIPFDKRALLTLTPEPWPDTPQRLGRFSTWLARRASRSAIPDPIVKAFVNPLRTVLERLKRNQPTVYQAFNHVVEEIRLSLPESEEPAFEIGMVLLLDETGLRGEADDAIQSVCDELQAKLKPDQARLCGVSKLTRSRMSVELHFRTALVDLENLTYDGDVIAGGEPLPPT